MIFDSSRRYRIAPAVTVRAEPFGALAYDFHRRQLTYLAAGDLVEVLGALDQQPSAAEAMAVVGVPPPRRAALERALGRLLEKGILDAA